MASEYRKGSTWRRIGVLLAIVAGLILLPGLIQELTDLLSEAPLYSVESFVDLRGKQRYRLIDQTRDGRVDCVLRVPALPWARQGFYREQPTGSCRGSRTRPMPQGMAELADELLTLRREAALSLSSVRDLDGDGEADCLEYDGTWRYAEGAVCPEKLRSDAAILTGDQRRAANRVLAIETELNSRWLDQPAPDTAP